MMLRQLTLYPVLCLVAFFFWEYVKASYRGVPWSLVTYSMLCMALFPIKHEHEAEQHHATRPHGLNDAAMEEFSVGEELEYCDSEPDDHEPHMFTFDTEHRCGH